MSLVQPSLFELAMSSINTFILDHFSLAFSYTSFFMVLTCIAVLISPLGKYRIGGADARPRFSRLSWFSIVLCTTVAVGILFWGSAEPLFHFLSPPAFAHIPESSPESSVFAMSAIFLHWGFTPYAIYSIPALAVALAIYNRNQAFSLSSPISPLLGKHAPRYANLIDMICLFALVSGMSASLGAGILSITGGLGSMWPALNSPLLIPLVTTGIITAFILSASSGIDHGIKNLSRINFFFFILFSLAIALLGPGKQIIMLSLQGFQELIGSYIPLSLQLGEIRNSEWTQSWSVFNWANWMAWAPITALFLGKIAYGRTVREFLLFNWFLPACFCLAWMGIFGGSTLYFASEDPVNFRELLKTMGPESIIYEVISLIGHAELLQPAFIIAMFISYVTAADSGTEAMASLSMKKFDLQQLDSDNRLKVTWGLLVGILAWVMITFAGIDGVKMLSNLGGLPALFLLATIMISLWKIMWQPSKYL